MSEKEKVQGENEFLLCSKCQDTFPRNELKFMSDGRVLCDICFQNGQIIERAKPCPKCNSREMHVFHVDSETLLDLDLWKESDTFEVDYYLFKCKSCNHYYL